MTTITRRRRPLTRRRILTAALRLVDREGLEALSMRRLGKALGVEAMSLYNHVPNKAALLDGIVELLLDELEIPGPEAGDWRERFRRINQSYRRVAHAHPRAFPLAITRPYNTPGPLRQVEATLQILHEAGFDAETALHLFQTGSSYTSGYVLAEITRTERPATEMAASAFDRHRLDAQTFPRLVALTAYYEARDRDAEFDYGLDAILRAFQPEPERPIA
ncbi:MAG: TetR/AcrR family transcriptional regulator C-terminal domain-containing protein [Dehalococcoidia bacterium]